MAIKHYNDAICYALAGIFGTISAFLFGLIPGMIFLSILWLMFGLLIDLPATKGGGQ
ncbi:DUF1056 family protein (plasmid) [Paucilactobacillus suebicus]|nr:DUF1056 family protein [Paucilactobacillus suebicus]